MKVGYLAFSGGNDVLAWSGIEYYMARSLRAQGLDLEYLGSMSTMVRNVCRMKKLAYMAAGKTYLCVRDPLLIKALTPRIHRRIARARPDVVFSAESMLVSRLECDQPIVFWGDATFGALVDYYDSFTNLCPETIRTGNELERSALNRCRIAIFNSEWAARSAIEHYGVPPSKVHVVPFGANLDHVPPTDQVRAMIEARPGTSCRLLFIGHEWRRKGGDRAVALARSLTDQGLPTTLDVVGATPQVADRDRHMVRLHGNLRKNNPIERVELHSLLAKAHFLALFSRAECCAVSLSEAGAFGVPALTSGVGGIPTAVKDQVNGVNFSMNSHMEHVAEAVLDLFRDRDRYRELAHGARREFTTRLSWDAAGEKVHDLLEEHCR